MKNLDDVIEEIESRLDEKDEVRELTIKSSRTIARLSGSAIQGMHRGHDVDTQLQETREEILKLRSLLKDHPDLYHTGIVENAMQEACEAFLVHSILEGEDPRRGRGRRAESGTRGQTRRGPRKALMLPNEANSSTRSSFVSLYH